MSATSLLYRLLADVIAYARLLLQSSSSQAAEIIISPKTARLVSRTQKAPDSALAILAVTTVDLIRFHAIQSEL